MHTINSQKGFTLIESIVYIALFAFVIGGGLMAAYQIFDGSAQIQTKAFEEAELNFVLRKLDWALNGIDVADVVNPTTGTDDNLIVNKGISQYRFFSDSITDTFSVLTAGETYKLTSDQLDVTNLQFTHTVNASPDPNMITITMDVNGTPIEPITRYVRTD